MKTTVMKKVLCGILTCVFLTAAFASCNRVSDGNTESELESGTPSVTEGGTESLPPDNAQQDEGIDIATDGKLNFCLVCGDHYNEYEKAIEYVITDLRRKLNLEITVLSEKPSDSETHAIYIGKNYEEIFPNAETQLTYLGYAALYHEGDIYLFGQTSDAMLNAAKKLLSAISVQDCITKDENGKVNMTIPTSLMFVYNPSYRIQEPILLSAHLSEYRIVYAHGAEYSVRGMAELIAERLGALTGYAPAVVTDDEPATEREILLGATNRESESSPGDPYGYSICGEGTKLCLRFGSPLAYDSILTNIQDVFAKDVVEISGEISDRIHMEKDDGDIRVMSFNILECNGELINAYRALLAGETIKIFEPDFVGLQEARGSIGDGVMSYLSEEYETINQRQSRQTPILYRPDRWTPATDEGGAVVKKAENFAEDGLWGYEWVMFVSNFDPSVKVIFMNLHIRNTNGGPQRAVDMDIFNAEVQRLEEVYPDIPLMITGDYNTGVSYERRGEIHDGWADDVIADTKIQSASQLTEDTDDEAGKLIDHVCVSTELVDAVRHRNVRCTMLEKASDHTPVFVDLKLKART